MISTIKYYDMAFLSEAAYVEFDKIDFSNSEKVKEALQNRDDYHGSFSATQAADFVATWKVVAHQENTSSGFSATLFRNIETGKLFYANRGTEPGPFIDDLVITDGGDIVTDGLAISQIIDMYNDWQRIQSSGVYQAAKLDLKLEETALLEAERLATPFGTAGVYEIYLRTRNDVIIDMPSGFVYTIEVVGSDQLFTDERAAGAGINVSGGITAVGHSLGGHLAAAFSRLFSECSGVLTINGAGFMTGLLAGLSGNAETNIRNLFAMLDGANSFDSSEILNLYGERGREITTMNNSVFLGQQGGHQEIYIESISGGNAVGHGSAQMTDALAVYDLFIRLDQRFQTDDFQSIFGELTPIFNAMETGRDQLMTYENIVNIFGKLFVDDFIAISGSQLGSREDLYRAIMEIRDRISEKSLHVTSLVSFSESEIASLAKVQDGSGLAARYALVNLNPFTVTGEPGLYDKFNMNGELDIHSVANEYGDLSDQFIEDRAKFLYYLAHPDATVPNFDPDIDFVDNRLGITLEVENGMWSLQDDSQYLFGNLEGEVLTGGDEIDHLYGMDGNDSLSGAGGDDYLEGGKGRDTINGDSGNDTFFIMGEDADYDIFNGGGDEDTIQGSGGDDTIRVHNFSYSANSIETIDGGSGEDKIAGTDGADTIDLRGTAVTGIEWIEGGGDEDTIIGTDGADILYGGTKDAEEDNVQDRLEGGIGADIYHVGAGDVIFDSDNQGTIYVNGRQISGMTLTGDSQRGMYSNTDGTITALHDTATQSLQICISDGSTPQSCTIEQFNPGDFGITLETAPAADRTLTGTDGDDNVFGHFIGVSHYYVFTGDISGDISTYWACNYQMFSYSAYGEVPPNLFVTGNAGNDRLAGMAGSDIISGGSDDDVIAGEVYFIDDGVPGPCWQGTGQGDILSGDEGRDFIAGFYGNDILSGGDDDDFLDGGDGSDTISGGAGNDMVLAGVGDNWLLGGAGNDIVMSERSIAFPNEVTDFRSISVSTLAFQLSCGEKGYVTGWAFQGFSVIADEDGGKDTLSGGDGNDLVYAGRGDDILYGEAGNDRLEGGAGNDILDGGDNNDLLLGDDDATQSGNDTLYGGAGQDELYGFAGEDFLWGGDGEDILLGGGGNDTVFGENDVDELQGQDGDDELYGGAGNDVLLGQAGSDILDGQGDSDYLDGGANDDVYLFGQGSGLDFIFDSGGSHGDTVRFGNTVTTSMVEVYQYGDNLILALSGDEDYLTLVDWFKAGANSVERVEFADGTVWNATIINALSFNLNNLPQQDTDDTAVNGEQPSLPGSPGTDPWLGDTGRYIYQPAGYVFSGEITELDVQWWAYRLYLQSLVSRDDSISSNQALTGSHYGDCLYGGTGDDTINGGGGDDYLVGHAGEDIIYGGVGQDRIFGNAGDDTLYGDDGDDVLEGGDGNDHLTDYSGNNVLNGGDGEDQILSGSGNDIVDGGAGKDYIADLYGGNDVLGGGAGDDNISGGNGSDILRGGVDGDLLYGGTGNDTLEGGIGEDWLDGGTGDDIYLFGRGDGSDHLYTWVSSGNWSTSPDTTNADVIRFAEGIAPDDVVITRSHLFQYSDTRYNYRNHDLVLTLADTGDSVTIDSWFNNPGARNITVVFADGSVWEDETIFWAAPLAGTAQDDRQMSIWEDNSLRAGDFNDILDGLAGNDELYGGTGDDVYLFGRGDGQDTIYEVSGTDTIRFKEGINPADVTVWMDSGNLYLGIAGADDRITVLGTFPHMILGNRIGCQLERVEFHNGTIWGQAELYGTPFQLSGTEDGDYMEGTENRDIFLGLSGNDVMIAGSGDDTFHGGEGDDNLYGGDGSDVLRGGEGADILDGGEGVDSADYRDSGEGILINLTDDSAKGGTATGDSFTSIERFYGSGYNDEFHGAAGNDTFFGFGGDDFLYGNDGNDNFQGREGNDELHGGEGNDILRGGEGADLLDGGVGADYADYRDSGEGVLIDLAAGTVSGGTASGDTFTSIENIYGSEYNDEIHGTEEKNILSGFGGEDVIRGNGGNDNLQGRDGNDELHGGEGNDILRGGEGVDILDGGDGADYADYRDSGEGVLIDLAAGTAGGGTASGDIFISVENIYGSEYNDELHGTEQRNILVGLGGNDELYGGDGNDTLRGGEGSDIFVFDTMLDEVGNKDIIADFTKNQDSIRLSMSIFTSLVEEGILSEENFCASATGLAADENDYILYNTTSGVLLYDMDGNGQGQAVCFAQLSFSPEIKAQDFVIGS